MSELPVAPGVARRRAAMRALAFFCEIAGHDPEDEDQIACIGDLLAGLFAECETWDASGQAWNEAVLDMQRTLDVDAARLADGAEGVR